MPQLHSIAVNGAVYELPSMNQYSGQLQDLARALSSVGVSAYDAAQALRRMNEVLGRLEWAENEITSIKDNLHDLRYQTESIQNGLDCRTAVLEMKIDELRPALDEKTETPKQKGDLEIFSQIEVNPFLPGFVDIDSEEYLQQRPLWDFTVDF